MCITIDLQVFRLSLVYDLIVASDIRINGYLWFAFFCLLYCSFILLSQLYKTLVREHLWVTLAEVQGKLRVITLISLVSASTAYCALELAYEVSDELEVFGIIEQFELHESLVLCLNRALKITECIDIKLLLRRIFHIAICIVTLLDTLIRTFLVLNVHNHILVIN